MEMQHKCVGSESPRGDSCRLEATPNPKSHVNQKKGPSDKHLCL
jgi:hypothetical protein